MGVAEYGGRVREVKEREKGAEEKRLRVRSLHREEASSQHILPGVSKKTQSLAKKNKY